MVTDGMSEYQGRKKKEQAKIWVYITGFPYSVFSKLCLTVEVKVNCLIGSKMFSWGKYFKAIIDGGGKMDIKGGEISILQSSKMMTRGMVKSYIYRM